MADMGPKGKKSKKGGRSRDPRGRFAKSAGSEIAVLRMLEEAGVTVEDDDVMKLVTEELRQAELLAARGRGIEAGREIKYPTPTNYARSAKLVNKAMGAKDSEGSFRHVTHLVGSIKALHPACAAVSGSDETLRQAVLDQYREKLAESLTVLAEEEGVDKDEVNRMAKQLYELLKNAVEAKGPGDLSDEACASPELVEVVAMLYTVEAIVFRGVIDGVGTILADGAYVQALDLSVCPPFDTEGRVDRAKLSEAASRVHALLEYVAQKAMPGGESAARTRIREFEKNYHYKQILWESGSLEQSINQFTDLHVNMQIIADRFGVELTSLPTLLLTALDEATRSLPTKPKGALPGCLDIGDSDELRIVVRDYVTEMREKNLEEQSETVQLSMLKARAAELDHKMGNEEIDPPNRGVKAKAARTAVGEGGGGDDAPSDPPSGRGRPDRRGNQPSPRPRSTSATRGGGGVIRCVLGAAVTNTCWRTATPQTRY